MSGNGPYPAVILIKMDRLASRDRWKCDDKPREFSLENGVFVTIKVRFIRYDFAFYVHPMRIFNLQNESEEI